MPQSSVDPVVSNNVRLAVEQTGRSPRDIAMALGHAPNWLYRVMKGHSGLLLPTLRGLAKELGVPLSSLVEDSQEPQGAPAPGKSSHPAGATSGSLSRPGLGLAEAPSGFVGIPEFDTPPVPGVPRSGTGIVGWEQVPGDQLGALGVDPAQCEIVRVRATVTNLLPTAGCIVLVDRSQREPKDGRVYLLHTREGLAVKRLVWDGGFAEWAFVTDGPESTRQRWPLWKDMVILGEALSGSAFYRSP